MKKRLPLLFLLLGLALVARSLLPERNKTDFDLAAFGRLPVVVNGRVKPLDTVARTSLVVFQSSQRITAPDGTLVPETGEGTSTETLSVSSSHSISSCFTVSPTFLNQVETVASETLSPRAGTITSVMIFSYLRAISPEPPSRGFPVQICDGWPNLLPARPKQPVPHR